MPGSSATKAPTTGSEVAAETGNGAAPGLSIWRGEAGGDAPSSSLSESPDSELTRRERASSSGTVKIEPPKFSLDFLVCWQEVPQHTTQPAKKWRRI
ncbi:unnamed protein product [Boreogadus saida]